MDNSILVLLILVVIFILLVILSKTFDKKNRDSGDSKLLLPPTAIVPVVPINQRTRGPIGPWKTVGILHSESIEDDTVFNLTARIIDRGRLKYEYKITDNETYVTIELFDGDEVDELEDGDSVTIPGYESKGQFVVLLNSKDELKYLPLNIF